MVCEMSEKYISKDYLHDKLAACELEFLDAHKYARAKGVDACMAIVFDAPTIKAEPRRNTVSKEVVKRWLVGIGVYGYDRQVDNLPCVMRFIEAEPIKHGRWEMYGAVTRGTLAIPIYRCSECKEDTNNWFWHYCPNCGAKMDEGAE